MENDIIKEPTVLVKLGFNIGDTFSTFKEFKEKLDVVSRQNFIRFWRRDSRTIEGAKKKTKRYLKSDLEFYQLRYACFYAQKHRPKVGLGKRKRRSLVKDIETACPASISLKVSDNGESLEICGVSEYHNHSVNEQEYQKLRPKGKPNLSDLMEDSGENMIFEDVTSAEDKYKHVLMKCRQIARLASVSSPKKVQEILKNLDDYIFYLKYNLPKDEQLRQELPYSTEDENIKIIVEPDLE
ncbi:hypothetical protein GWI33_016597 [Rhynchophorus ferrugineus]|uniref:ZSWIM3 N-terminal domain-containing protein n=1 Tax=Rhynchophorus ferrugineus TaxID=354439 RepID=A0A834IAV2_RHYFE|nr:hypothetical protein GWI33_016597 [Rhynchophorus ferrugineus]